MAIDLEQLNIVLEGDTKKADKAIDQLVGKLGELKGALGDLSSVQGAVGKATGSVVTDISGQVSVTDRLAEKSTEAAAAAASVKVQTDKATEAVKGSSKAYRDAIADIKRYYSLLKTSQTQSDVGVVQGQYVSKSGVWDDLANALNGARERYMGIANIQDELSDDQLEGVVKTEQKAFEDYAIALDKAAAAQQKVKKSTEELHKTAKAAKGPIEKLLSAVGRIALYRAIRSAIKGITQAVSEGKEIFVEWDRTYNNGMAGAAKTSDELAGKWREVKKAIGAAVMPIIQAVQPAIEWIMNKVIDLFNFIQQVVRALQGETTWYRAVYREAKKTTDQAKELKRVVFGFDELNILPSASGSGASDEIGKWEYELEDIPDKFELIKKGALILGGALGTAGLLGVIKKLIKGIGGKNSALGEEATQTAADAAQSLALSGALGAVLGSAMALKDYLSKNPSNVQINVPAVDFSEQQAAVEEWQEWVDSNAVELGLKVRADYETSMQEGLKAGMVAGAAASSVTAQVPVLVNTSGIGTALSNALSDYQKQLNNNPLKVPVQVGNSVTGKGSANIKVTNVNGVSTVKNSAKASAEMDGLLAASGAAAALAALGGSSGSYPKGAISKANADRALQELFTNTQSRKDLYWQGVDKGWENFEKYVMNDASASVAATAGAAGVLGNLLKLLPVFGLAEGGSPEMGSLFIAGERGPEIVTKGTNNQTGVMNAQQIQSAMGNANSRVVEALYSVANRLENVINSKPNNTYLDGRLISENTTSHQNNAVRMWGRAQMV